MRTARSVVGWLLCLTAAALAWAQVPEVAPTDLRVTDVAVFKHGYGFVMAEGKGKTRDGWLVFSQVPQASLGTLWLYSPQAGVKVDRAIAEVRETKQKQDARDLTGLIEANIGSQATLVVGYGQETRSLLGTLQKPIYTDRQRSPQSQQDNAIWAAVPPRPADEDGVVSHIMLKTVQGEVAIPVNLVREVTFATTARREREVVKPQQVLAARLVRDGKTVSGDSPVGMAYLAKGLRWIPNYRLEITGEGQARLRLQGTVINDVADLQDSRLHLVIGVPHFIQQDVVSPLSLQVAWTQLSSYFAPVQQRQQDVYSNAMMAQVVMGPRGDMGTFRGEAAPASGAAVAPVTGEGVEELFFYRVSDLTLKRGSRAAVSIIDEAVTYEDVYLWDVKDDPEYARRRWSPYYFAQQQQQQPRTPEQEAMQREMLNPKVWHALRIKNETKAPWTTAPALVVKDWQPVSQSMLLYTPVNGSVDLTTTVAPDIVSSRSDLETSRQAKSITVSGYNYDLVKVKGELRLANHKAQAVRLVVTRQLEGAVDEVTADGKSEKLAEGFGGLNPTSRLTWDFSLAAGAEMVLGYTYSVYVRV